MAKQKTPAYLRLENKNKHHNNDDLRAMIEKEKELKGDSDLIVEAPDTLSELGKQYYNFLVSQLIERDILSNLDIPILEQTADCLDKMQIADEKLNEEGLFQNAQDSRGNRFLKEHPAVATKQKYLNQFRYCAGQLGLSPSSRAQIAQNSFESKKEEEKPLKQLLDKKKNKK